MSQPFEPLRETLLSAGVAPARVRRYLRELSEHYADLVGEEQKAGLSLDEAKAAARVRLGADEALAEAMLAQPALRSWTARAPWATLVVGPFLLLFLAWLVPILGIALVLLLSRGTNGRHLAPDWLPPVGGALLDLVQFAGPLLIVAGVALLGARQRSRLIWPFLGCLAVAFLGGSLIWGAHWPVVGSRESDLSIGLRGLHPSRSGGSFSLAVWSHGLPLVALSLVVAAAVYWMARRPGTWATR